MNFKTLYSHHSDTGIHEEDGSNVLKLFREAVAWRHDMHDEESDGVTVGQEF